MADQVGYSNTILIDCNRLHSEQAKSGNDENPALFTNKTGHGIQVKAGDKMSVYSSFISEIGAGADAIEFKGEDLGKTRTITYTNVLNLSKINGCNSKPQGFERCQASNVTETIPIKDNECTLLLNYYKTANGEGHVHQPRRFFFNNITGYDYNLWTSEDNVGHGRPYVFKYNHKGNTIPYISASMTINTYGIATPQKFFVEDDWMYVPTPSPVNEHIKKRTDGTKYKIFIRADTKYGIQSDGDNTLESGISPAEMEYHEYIERVDIKLDRGFSSPSAIAEKITGQLQQSEEPYNLFYYQNLLQTNVFSASNIPRPISVLQQSKTYKPFYSCSVHNNNQANWLSWVEGNASNEALLWEASYKYIGHKRPELYIKGRELAKHLLTNFFPSNTQIGKAGTSFLWDLERDNFLYKTSNNASSHIIPLNLSWTKENLEKLSNFFKEQKYFPELFVNETNHYRGVCNASNSRYLHLNHHSASFTGGMNFNYQHYLGNDMVFVSASDSGFLAGFTSKPLFFDFNPDYEDIYTEGRSWDSGYSFGFGKKYVNASGNEFIALTTNKALGWTITGEKTIAEDYYAFNESSSGVNTKVAKNTLIGFDVHFSAYGTSAIQISDGMAGVEFNNIGTRKLNNFTTAGSFGNGSANASVEVIQFGGYSYLGADQPKLVFNTTSNRFEITDLHTAERKQNKSNAGSV